MTSGTFKSLPLSSITINRAGRQRRELTGIKELANSIAEIGLINPIVVTPEGVLIAGERRLAAVTSLNHTSIIVQYSTELPPDVLQLIELEENIKREELPWQDKVEAVRRYHELRQAMQPDWTADKTAEVIGETGTSVRSHLRVSKEIERTPELKNEKKFSVARSIASRQNERRASAELEVLELEKAPNIILNLDFNEWAKTYNGPKFNLLHCDFPYGINLHKTTQIELGPQGAYDDSFYTYERLLTTLGDYLYTILEESAHIVFWFSMKHYEYTKKSLENIGFKLSPFPLIWVKSDNSGIIPDPQRGPRQIYETAFLGSLGDRKIVRAVANAFSAPTTKEIHTSEKSTEMLRYFLSMLVDENTTILDPTAGSGSALFVAKELRARRILGLEINPSFTKLANKRLTK